MTEEKKTSAQVFEELRKEIGSNYEDDAIKAYINIMGADYATADGFEESYIGKMDNDEEFARDIFEQIGGKMPSEWPYYCIDWEAAARDLMYDYAEEDGYYFRNV